MMTIIVYYLLYEANGWLFIRPGIYERLQFCDLITVVVR